MKSASAFLIVLVTAPDAKTARRLAKLALEQRLVACANLVPGLESHYWWQGKLDTSKEVLILFKTERKRLGALEQLVLEQHPYDTPECIALELNSGTKRYLEWIRESVGGEQRSKRRLPPDAGNSTT